MEAFLPILAHLIRSNDEKDFADACWVLSELTDGTIGNIQAVIEAGVCPRLIELLPKRSRMLSNSYRTRSRMRFNSLAMDHLYALDILLPVLRTVGNIVTGDDIQTQVMIDHHVLPRLLNLLMPNYPKFIKKKACWTISNITAGNRDQIQAVINSGIIAALVHLLQNAEFEIKKEAAWAISNATSGGSRDQIRFLVSQGCIKPLCDLLVCRDPRIVTVCLEGLENILKIGEAEKFLGYTEGVNVYAQLIEDAEGLKKIENLQSHDNNEIYGKALKILETYWLVEDDVQHPSADAPFGGGNPSVPSGGFNFV